MENLVIKEKRRIIFKYLLMFSALLALTGWFLFDLYKSPLFSDMARTNIAFLSLYTMICIVTALSFCTFVYLFAKFLFPSSITIDSKGIKSKGIGYVSWKQISNFEYLQMDSKSILKNIFTFMLLSKILSPFVIVSYLWDLTILRKPVATRIVKILLKNGKKVFIDFNEHYTEKTDATLLKAIKDYQNSINQN